MHQGDADANQGGSHRYGRKGGMLVFAGSRSQALSHQFRLGANECFEQLVEVGFLGLDEDPFIATDGNRHVAS